jgi:hypothetical protein
MTTSKLSKPDDILQAKIVNLILNKKTEEALEELSNFYCIDSPQIVVGTIKGKRRTVNAVYVQRERKIYAVNSDILHNPFVVLHEFYHHVRTKAGEHRGSERHADMYAQHFISAYRKIWEGSGVRTSQSS